MMAEIQTRFRELSVCNQAECFLSPAGRNNCMKLLLFNLFNKLEAKFWLVPGKLDCRKLTWFLFLKINIFLEKCEISLNVVALLIPSSDRWSLPEVMPFPNLEHLQSIPRTFAQLVHSVFVDCWHPASNRDPRWVCSQLQSSTLEVESSWIGG